jgi:hypothetical protein
MALLATTSYAKVENSAHDFDRAGGTFGVGMESMCSYCHVPHRAQSWANTALWATQDPNTNGTFEYYSSANLAASSIQVEGSQTCLACHADGATATTGLSQAVSGNLNVGYDLRNDHPIGIAYNAAGGGVSHSLRAFPVTLGRTTFTTGGTYTVECATCHSVHGLSNRTIQTRALLYGPGASADAAGWPSDTDFCLICHDR